MTVNPLTQDFITSLNKHRDQLHGKRIWLACSGGRDSLSMAKLCHDLYDTGALPFLPQLLHVNHGIQHANDAWARQVQAWAHQHNMNCQVLSITLEGDKSEQSARLARYDAMQAVMNCDDVLMLGHHRDDQVETVLMRLFNGTGVNGLGGMRAWTAKQFGNKTIYLWRPWLTISRVQITDYAKSSQLDYIDDPTNVMTIKDDNDNNDATTNDRAWLRGVLMPVIHERYNHASESIARTSELMQDASDIIKEQVQADLLNLIVPNAHSSLTSVMQSVLNIDKLLQLSLARQSAVIHHWLSPSHLEVSPSHSLVNKVLTLCQRDNNNHQTCLYWNNNHQQYEIRRYKNKLYRLHTDWIAWLDLLPLEQRINLDITAGVDNDDDLAITYDLKSKNTKFSWQLHTVNKLAQSLSADCTGLDAPIKGHTVELHFAPLPREIKLSLVGRVGRKSGKKLLQAIGVPAFMRTTVVLVSLSMPSESMPSKSAPCNKNLLPLIIITLEGIHVLQSPYANTIKALIASGQLTTTVFNKMTH